MISIGKYNGLPAELLEIELVERKGLAHPDTLIDNIMESISRALCKEYLNNFGRVAHHNVDKGLLIGGESNPVFGGGKITKPITVYMTGRATKKWQGKTVDIDDIAVNAAKQTLKQVRNLNVTRQVKYISNIRQGSKDLVELFFRSKKPLANDTSLTVGYSPMSRLEKTVLNLEKEMNSSNFKKTRPWLGEDIKIMGLRNKKNMSITIAAAFVSKYVSDIKEYQEHKSALQEDLSNFVSSIATTDDIELFLNTADSKNSAYITVTGTSAEAGDDGSIGRGNRINGLITPMRPMTLEAAAGKNPVSHVGKIYSAVSFKISEMIYQELDVHSTVYMMSQIGKPLSQPKIVNVNVYGRHKEQKIREIVEYNLDNVEKFTNDFINARISIA